MKKQVSLAMATVMALSLAACGGSPSSSSAAAADSGAAATDSTGSDATGEAASWGDVTLTMWGAEEDQTMLREMADAFIAENADKGNITINIGA